MNNSDYKNKIKKRQKKKKYPRSLESVKKPTISWWCKKKKKKTNEKEKYLNDAGDMVKGRVSEIVGLEQINILFEER